MDGEDRKRKVIFQADKVQSCLVCAAVKKFKTMLCLKQQLQNHFDGTLNDRENGASFTPHTMTAYSHAM